MRGRSQTKWWGVVLEAPDAHSLAEFYTRVLDWPLARSEPGWAVIKQPGVDTYLAFQASTDYAPPVWPSTPGSQQMMMHLDIEVDDLDTAVTEWIGLGATLAPYQPQDDVRVLLDPAGHPFCLYLDK